MSSRESLVDSVVGEAPHNRRTERAPLRWIQSCPSAAFGEDASYKEVKLRVSRRMDLAEVLDQEAWRRFLVMAAHRLGPGTGYLTHDSIPAHNSPFQSATGFGGHWAQHLECYFPGY